MERVMFFVDGFNIYHSLKKRYSHYLWLDYYTFATRFIIPSKQVIEAVFWYTAKATWLPESVRRHEQYIEALTFTQPKIKVIEGLFKQKSLKCQAECKREYPVYREKRSDVALAVDLYRQAHLDRFDVGFLVTNDTDFVPAIHAVKQDFPGKKIVVLFPIGRKSHELRMVADETCKTKEKHLKTSQLPDQIVLPSGMVLTRPASWKLRGK